MSTILQCFKIILEGDKAESRAAARQIRRLVYGSGESDKYQHFCSIVVNAPKEYEKITEEWRQENFVVAISVMYFLHDRENQPDFLFPWLFSLIQHANGNIRHAAVRMFETELGPLTHHVRFPSEQASSTGLIHESANATLFELYANLVNLSDQLWLPAYKKYKYISSLPASPYKSIQMVLGELEDSCGKDYMARLQDVYFQWQIVHSRKSTIKRVVEGNVLDKAALVLAQSKLMQMREGLEKDIVPPILKLYPKFKLQDAVAQVYEGKFSIAELTKSFEDFTNSDKHTVDQINALLQLVSTIWNIYPHKELDGYSPYELAAMYEIDKNHQDLK